MNDIGSVEALTKSPSCFLGWLGVEEEILLVRSTGGTHRALHERSRIICLDALDDDIRRNDKAYLVRVVDRKVLMSEEVKRSWALLSFNDPSDALKCTYKCVSLEFDAKRDTFFFGISLNDGREEAPMSCLELSQRVQRGLLLRPLEESIILA